MKHSSDVVFARWCRSISMALLRCTRVHSKYSEQRKTIMNTTIGKITQAVILFSEKCKILLKFKTKKAVTSSSSRFCEHEMIEGVIDMTGTRQVIWHDRYATNDLTWRCCPMCVYMCQKVFCLNAVVCPGSSVVFVCIWRFVWRGNELSCNSCSGENRINQILLICFWQSALADGYAHACDWVLIFCSLKPLAPSGGGGRRHVHRPPPL